MAKGHTKDETRKTLAQFERVTSPAEAAEIERRSPHILVQGTPPSQLPSGRPGSLQGSLEGIANTVGGPGQAAGQALAGGQTESEGGEMDVRAMTNRQPSQAIKGTDTDGALGLERDLGDEAGGVFRSRDDTRQPTHPRGREK